MIEIEDRLWQAIEYCRFGGIRVPGNRRLERSLKQCKEFNFERWIPYRLKEREELRRGAKRGARRFQERHGKESKYILNGRIRGSITGALKKRGSGLRGRQWENLVGYKLKNLERRLRRTIPEGYTWQDFLDGRLWIDHIIPVSAFNFTKSEHIDFKRCWALKNLRLLTKEDNIRKSNKLRDNFQSCLKV